MIAEISVTAVGIAFVAMGAAALWRPDRVTRLFGVDAVGPDLANEVRAVYGGFGVALGLLLLLSPGAAAAGVRLTAAVSLLGMAAGRLYSWCLQRSGHWPRVFFVIEVAAGAALLWTLPGASAGG